jgi:hypothetical protein
LAHGLQRLPFSGYRHSLWRQVGPLAGVEPASDRLEALADHGFSRAGERVLRHGSAAATLRIGPQGELAFVDPSGKERKSLPRAKGASPRDVEEMNAAVKGLRRRVKNTFTIACEGFEAAMIAGRAWSPAALRARFVDHPIGAAIGASLVFLLCDGRSFRIAGGVPRDLSSREISVDAPARIAHPIDLSPEARDAWRAQIGSAPPFPQLDRELHPASLPDIAPGPYAVDALLERFAARRYLAGRGNILDYHCRDVGPYFTLVVEHAPIRWNETSGEMEVLGIRVRSGELDVPPATVPRSLLSELQADAARLGLEPVKGGE